MSNVEKHYDSDPELEWNRLGKKNPIEYAITMLALQEYLPAPLLTILDVGGGPGRYAIALTQQGYSVTLLDLSRGNLQLARKRASELEVELAGYIHGNALDLSHFADESFDAVLLMGPLYHLLELEERIQAIQEAKRVLKHAGTLFVAFITRSSYIRFSVMSQPWCIRDEREDFMRVVATGKYQPAPGQGFTDAYFAHHHEIRPFMEQCGLQTLDLIACEGFVSMIDDKLNEQPPEIWEAWVNLNYAWSKDPATHGTTEHLLYVGRKP
jgi:ubiquinone/menaquinone biosynthesis C-methylase UbiE